MATFSSKRNICMLKTNTQLSTNQQNKCLKNTRSTKLILHRTYSPKLVRNTKLEHFNVIYLIVNYTKVNYQH